MKGFKPVLDDIYRHNVESRAYIQGPLAKGGEWAESMRVHVDTLIRERVPSTDPRWAQVNNGLNTNVVKLRDRQKAIQARKRQLKVPFETITRQVDDTVKGMDAGIRTLTDLCDSLTVRYSQVVRNEAEAKRQADLKAAHEATLAARQAEAEADRRALEAQQAGDKTGARQATQEAHEARQAHIQSESQHAAHAAPAQEQKVVIPATQEPAPAPAEHGAVGHNQPPAEPEPVVKASVDYVIEGFKITNAKQFLSYLAENCCGGTDGEFMPECLSEKSVLKGKMIQLLKSTGRNVPGVHAVTKEKVRRQKAPKK